MPFWCCCYLTSTFLIPSGFQLGGITWLPAFSLHGNSLPQVTAMLPNRSFTLIHGLCCWARSHYFGYVLISVGMFYTSMYTVNSLQNNRVITVCWRLARDLLPLFMHERHE